jgi:hypothetical protein
LQRRDRIERISKPAKTRGRGHELGNALGPLGAHRMGVEAALLPDHAGEELHRQVVLGGVLLDGAADIVGDGRIVRRPRLRGALAEAATTFNEVVEMAKIQKIAMKEKKITWRVNIKS